jgi:hypothetical protein
MKAAHLEYLKRIATDLDQIGATGRANQLRYIIGQLSAQSAAHDRADVGAGWVLVPAEPMPEMVAAWWRVKNTGSTEPGETGEDRSDCAAYRAMVAAAPRPPAKVGA